MTCRRCRKHVAAGVTRCPHCGEPQPDSGVFKTSTVWISTADTDRVFESVEKVPPPLQEALRESTNSANSATIVIADRRGRREVAETQAEISAAASPERLSPFWRRAIFLALLLAVAALTVALLAIRR